MSILNNQTEKDLAKHPRNPLPTEGNYYNCYRGIKAVLSSVECKMCPFKDKCSWYSELETRDITGN